MLIRHKTNKVIIGNVAIGANEPIAIQSMTNTDTEDIESTVKQILELNEAGSEIVRVTVNTKAAAKNISKIKDSLIAKNCFVPIVGDFHYNGHELLNLYPDCAKSLAKYRINPGNVGYGKKKDLQFEMMINTAIKYNKPVRIGVNWGSLDQNLAAKLMDENSKKTIPLNANEVLKQALVISALDSAKFAENIGLASDKIVVSCKVSKVQDLIDIYQNLAEKCSYPLHLGLTEAGIGSKAIVATSSAFGVLLQQGIGDTIRASITPEPGTSRTKEVQICQEILQTMNIRSFKPLVTSCPGCGRTSSDYFQKLALDIQNFINTEMPIWQKKYPKAKDLDIAVMGCIVNGPGESKHANIGISLPGSGENPAAPIFVDGKKIKTLRGDNIGEEFKEIIKSYLADNCS